MFFYYFVNSGTFSHIIKKKKNNIKIEKIDQESWDIPELMWPNANRTLFAQSTMKWNNSSSSYKIKYNFFCMVSFSLNRLTSSGEQSSD